MRITTRVSASVIAIALTATMSSVSASGQSPTPNDPTATPKPADQTQSSTTQFATLKDVKAVPMASGELDAVKGLHIHFTTPGNNTTGPFGSSLEGWHFVNHQENNLGNGQAPRPGSGPGYSGLCGAALNSPALAIPGQNPVTGVGGGC